MEFFALDEKVPTGWRLGIFLMNTRVMKGFSEEYVRDYIAYWSGKSGLAVAKETLNPLTFSMPIGNDPGQPWGAWVNFGGSKLTTREFSSKAKIPSIFSVTTAPSEVDWYLETFQGPWMADVSQAKVSIWATPNSPLAGGTWYAAGAYWSEGSPSEGELERRLHTIGCELWSGPNNIAPFKAPHGMVFVFRTPPTGVKVSQVRDAIGSISLTIDLNAPVDNAYLTTAADKLMESAYGIIESIGTTGAGVSEFLQGSGEALKTTGSIMRYLPWILAAGGLAYLWFKNKKSESSYSTAPTSYESWGYR